MTDFRLGLNKDTQMCMSLSARPGNFGTRLHNFLYARLGLNFFYKSFTTRDICGAVIGIRALGIRGCAISMPFKEDVMQYLDRIEISAARIDAVNTIVNEGGVLTGSNTDYLAIQRLFVGKHVPLSASIAVAGSGGMAKAIAAALDDSGYRAVTLIARNEKTGSALAERYGFAWRRELGSDETFEVLVNTTPSGMAPDMETCPFPARLIDGARFVVDSVVNPIETRLITAARSAGKTTIDGFEITVLQSVEQFTQYTGVAPDPETLRAAVSYVSA